MLSPRKLSGLQQRWLLSWLYRSRNRITTKHVTGMKQTPAKSYDQPVFPPSVLFAWWEIIMRTTVRLITGKWKKNIGGDKKKNIEFKILLVFFTCKIFIYLYSNYSVYSEIMQVVFIKNIIYKIMICFFNLIEEIHK